MLFSWDGICGLAKEVGGKNEAAERMARTWQQDEKTLIEIP
jgi:hypothetical protein